MSRSVPGPHRSCRLMQALRLSVGLRLAAAGYKPGLHTFTRERIGARYLLLGIRVLVDPADPTT